VIQILKLHNQWRRGDESVKMQDPKQIGLALDIAVRLLSQFDTSSNCHDKHRSDDNPKRCPNNVCTASMPHTTSEIVCQRFVAITHNVRHG
jgi:hypothetical protein